MAPSVTTLFGGAMLFVGGIILLVSGRYVWRATAVLRATEVDALADRASNALVRVSGTVSRETEDILVAPFSGVECVAVRYQIEERRLSTLYLLPWYVTVREGTGAVEFAVQSAVGTVPVVEPVRTVVLQNEVVETVRADEDPSERVREFERSKGASESTVWQTPPSVLAPLFRFLSLGARRYSEQRAARGAEITVVGRVTDDGAGLDPIVVSDRAPMATVLRMAKTSIAGLCIGGVGVLLGYVVLFLG
ncbi:hypothetical protein [Haloplanus sp. C73]|uniref:hypothetical protein n=1 Tax=Haloplanus sp. C73 TaxID=3421641 RepID=UPI003EC05A36